MQYDKTFFKVLLLTIVLTLFCYPKVNADPYSLLEAFSADEMKDDLFHPLMVLLGFGLIKIYYMHRLTQDTVGLTGMRFFENYLTGQKLKSRLNSLLKPLGKFKKIVAKITNVKRIFKVPKGTQQGYKDNPAYKLYMVSVCLWGYIGYFMFYRVVYKSNFDTTLGNKFKQYDCFYNDIKCHNRKAFFYSRIIYATLLLWMFVMVFQIKYGLLVWSSTLIDFNRYNSIRFAIYSPIPFMRELLVIMSFTANKTALTLRDWLMIEDIKDTMTRSKFRVQEKDKRDFVRPLQSTAKILAAIAVVLVALLIVVGPMIPFSDFIKSNIEYKILSSQVKVDIVTAKGYSLNPFFSSNLMLRSDTIQDTDPKWSFLSQSEKRKETKPNFVKYIKMSRYSRDFYEYSNATQIPTDLETILLDSKIQIHLMMKTEEGEFKKEFHVPISSSHASEIKSVMQLDCKSSTINREIFLENIPMVYQLGNNFELEAVKEPIILKYLYKKWSLGVECSSSRFSLTQPIDLTFTSQSRKRIISSSPPSLRARK